MEKKNINDTDIIDDIETEERLIRPTYTKALGKINKYSPEEIVEKGLADDEKLLTEVFKMFNNEFYDGKLSEPIIHISHAVKEEVGIKITNSEEWIKYDEGKIESCKGLYFSDKILKYGVVSDSGMVNAYIMFAVGMIALYDTEIKEAYKNGADIRNDKEKAEDVKKGSKSKGRKKAYQGMITRGGYYFTKEFANECKRIGIIATANPDKEGKYELSAGEIFIKVLEKYGLLERRFVCAKYQQIKRTETRELMVQGSILEEKKSSVRTYQCPICELNVRGTKSGLRIKCCSESHPNEEPMMKELSKEEIKQQKAKKRKESERRKREERQRKREEYERKQREKGEQ